MMKSVSAWKQELSSGAHAARLAALYCCAPEETPAQAARYEAVLNGLDATFGPHAEAGLYSAPGRTEIGGTHPRPPPPPATGTRVRQRDGPCRQN